MRRSTLVATAVIAIALVAFLYLYRESFSPSRERLVRIGYLPVSTSLPIMLAEKKGLFAQRDLQVSLVRYANSNLMLTALRAGEIDATAVCADEPILRAASRAERPGFFIYLQEILSEDRAFDTIVVRSGSKIRGLKDLEGGSLACFPGTQLRIYAKMILAHGGADPSKVKLIQLPPANMLPSLASGTVDALLALEPIGTLAVATKQGEVLLRSPICRAINAGKPLCAASFLVSESFARTSPELVRDFVTAVYDAVDAIESDYESAATLYPTFTPIPEGIAQNVVITRFARADSPDLDGLRRQIEILRTHGGLENDYAVDRLILPATIWSPTNGTR